MSQGRAFACRDVNHRAKSVPRVRSAAMRPQDASVIGDPDTIRTCDLPLRRGTLYPAELRGRKALRIVAGATVRLLCSFDVRTRVLRWHRRHLRVPVRIGLGGLVVGVPGKQLYPSQRHPRHHQVGAERVGADARPDRSPVRPNPPPAEFSREPLRPALRSPTGSCFSHEPVPRPGPLDALQAARAA